MVRSLRDGGGVEAGVAAEKPGVPNPQSRATRRSPAAASRRRRAALFVIAAVALPALVAGPLSSCHQALFTAPPGSTITLYANPPSIPAFGGVSVITAVVIEPAGTPVSDGTVVQFFTTLGGIEEQGKTNDGVARVRLTSDTRSGTATITAFSGGGTAPPTSGTPGDGTGTGTGGTASASLTVQIGATLPKRVVVTADPPVLASQRWSSIEVNVYDEQGDPVPRVPVHLVVTEGEGLPAGYESLDSDGAPLFTDNNGRVLDTLRTSYPSQRVRRTVTITATTTNGTSGTVVVQINTVEPAPTPTPPPAVDHILVVANPTAITAATTALITAYAREADGRPMPGIGLIFTVTPPGLWTLASGSTPITTGAAGDAQDTLATTYVGPPDETVTVTVTAPNGVTGSVRVLVQ